MIISARCRYLVGEKKKPTPIYPTPPTFWTVTNRFKKKKKKSEKVFDSTKTFDDTINLFPPTPAQRTMDTVENWRLDSSLFAAGSSTPRFNSVSHARNSSAIEKLSWPRGERRVKTEQETRNSRSHDEVTPRSDDGLVASAFTCSQFR